MLCFVWKAKFCYFNSLAYLLITISLKKWIEICSRCALTKIAYSGVGVQYLDHQGKFPIPCLSSLQGHDSLNLFILDNIFSIKSWIKNKFSFEESVIDKQFGIPEDLDYLD